MTLQQEGQMGSPERKEIRVVSARVIKWDEHHFGIVAVGLPAWPEPPESGQ
jgi:hypothetical protein